MAKHSKDFKLKCVKSLDESLPLPKYPGVSEKTILRHAQNCRRAYRIKGESILENTIIYRNYKLQDKIKACERVMKGESMRKVALDLGMANHSTVRRWFYDYSQYGIAGLQYRKGKKPVTMVLDDKPMKKPLTNSEREELIALRKRNEILEAEIDFLKKLDALVSKKEKTIPRRSSKSDY